MWNWVEIEDVEHKEWLRERERNGKREIETVGNGRSLEFENKIILNWEDPLDYNG